MQLQELYKRSLFKSSIILSVASMYLMRPSFFGESFNFFGSVLFLVSSLIVALSTSPSREHFSQALLRAGPILFLWLYLLVHSQVRGVSSPFPFYSAIICVIVCTGSVLLFSSQEAGERFILLLITVMAALGLSSAVSFLLTVAFPVNSVVVATVTSPTYGEKQILFPLSIGYELKRYAFATTYRFCMFWREVGIAQAIYCWALLSALRSQKLRAKRWIVPSLALGVAASQSTIAYSNLAITFAAWVILFSNARIGTKIISIVLSLPVAGFLIYFSIYDESIGLMSKIEGASALDRLNAVRNAISYVYSDPWGFGMYGDNGIINANSGISLVASVSAIGILGFAAVIFAWICAIAISDQRMFRFFSLLPIMFTALTSQPLLDSFGVWIIFISPSISYRSNSKVTGIRSSAMAFRLGGGKVSRRC